MLTTTVAGLLARELRTLERELEAYPTEAQIWEAHPALPNTAGTLALHAAGNLLHFIGAILGGTGYVRDRDAEFNRRGVGRDELLAGLRTAREVVTTALPAVPASRLDEWYPLPVASRRVRTGEFLVHLTTHLAYHVGQVDYHRRITTADPKGVGAVSPTELPGAVPVEA
jgi:hypothetical protein